MSRLATSSKFDVFLCQFGPHHGGGRTRHLVAWLSASRRRAHCVLGVAAVILAGGGEAVNYAHAFNIIGLVMNLGGVILLFVFGLPFCVRTSIILEQPDPKAVRAECWYDVFGWLGLALIILGTAAQIKAMVL